MKVIRDANGTVINIGDWEATVENDPETGAEIFVTGSPLPEGATESDEVVVTGWDGGRYVEGDPRAERH